MDNCDQYLLQVLRRTQHELQDSLIPAHAEKFGRVVEKLEQAPSLRDEIIRLQTVKGFTRAALALQWILERAERSSEDFSTGRLDADASLLNDKFFEAFLSEPFGATEPARAKAPPSAAELPFESFEPQPVIIEERKQTTASAQTMAETPSPALTEILDQNLLLAFQRFAEIVSKMGEKTPAERKSIFAVLGMIAKSSVEVARQQNKEEVLEFFQSVIKFITAIDAAGTAQDARVAETMRDVGERLNAALKEKSNGIELLTSINAILQNPDLFSGR
ncbi:MAG: hypothetical protein KGJ59_03845 [Bacteroidota bacterium]|nr:hypothetical protein [Bacteroidota bacterium]